MSLRKGDRVVAIDYNGTGPLSAGIRSGTSGVVVEEGWAFASPRIVFDGYAGMHSVDPDNVRPA